MKVLVVGGGIGGLTAALALAREGAGVRLLERAADLAGAGTGIQVSPNGFAVLRALGVAEAVRGASVAPRGVSLREGGRGREVFRLDLSRRDYGFIHRADLIAILAGAARDAGAELIPGAEVQRAEPSDDGPPSLHTSGDTLRADLVVGADGLHSVVRGALDPGLVPRFTGQIAWRAIVPGAGLHHPDEARVHMGPGRHLVSYPLRGGDLVNIVAVEERQAAIPEGWGHSDDSAAMRAAFKGFGGIVPALLERLDEVRIWGLYRHDVAPVWQGGGLALMGDAAHPMLPFLAQGANMALEDAWVLSRCTRDLPAYQARRAPRVRRVAAAAAGNTWKYHLRPGPLRFAAHSALRLGGRLAPGLVAGGFEWLYGHDVTRTRPGA